MSYEELKLRNVKKTKKPHRCIWCGEEIKAGDPAVYRAYIFQGVFNSDYVHPERIM